MKFKSNQTIILASKSPRRMELLQLAGVPFKSVPSNVLEKEISRNRGFVEYAQSLAISKAMSISGKYPDAVVIGADTIVGMDDRIFPKPVNATEAKAFLRAFSGRTHSVITGVAIVVEGRTYTFYEETEVTFLELEDELIDRYVASGDPMDKAGAYGIQSSGALFVQGIKGDYYSVMGLPIAVLVKHLRELGVLQLDGGASTFDN